jgi:Trk K+ transport system NAD-binding subunit
VLTQVGVDNVDVAVAASNNDGRNVIIAMQAKRLGIRKVIAIVEDPEYLDLLSDQGIVAISAPWTTAGLVESHLDRPGVAELFEIETGTAHLLGVIVPDGAQVADVAIRDLDLPRKSVVAAVIRNNEFVVPRGDTVISVGDHVVFVGPAGAVKAARDAFLALRVPG